jgi:hypothetical protein
LEAGAVGMVAFALRICLLRFIHNRTW